MPGVTIADRPGSVVLGREDEGRIAFHPPMMAENGSGSVPMPVLIEAPGLAAEATIELEARGGGAPGLAGYVADIAASWRGWPGIKEWRDDGAAFEMSAGHDGKGTVELRLAVASAGAGDRPGGWRLEVPVALDPGSLEASAAVLRRLLTPER